MEITLHTMCQYSSFEDVQGWDDTLWKDGRPCQRLGRRTVNSPVLSRRRQGWREWRAYRSVTKCTVLYTLFPIRRYICLRLSRRTTIFAEPLAAEARFWYATMWTLWTRRQRLPQFMFRPPSKLVNAVFRRWTQHRATTFSVELQVSS